MKATYNYIEAAKAALELPSNYAMAKWLGVSETALSQWKNGRRVIDDYTAAKLAQALGIPAMEIIAAANFEREKDEKRREFWRTYGIAAGLAVFAVISKIYGFEFDENNFVGFYGLSIMRRR